MVVSLTCLACTSRSKKHKCPCCLIPRVVGIRLLSKLRVLLMAAHVQGNRNHLHQQTISRFSDNMKSGPLAASCILNSHGQQQHDHRKPAKKLLIVQ